MSSHRLSSIHLGAVELSLWQSRLNAMRLCCAHAREAGIDGRLGAAHGLFQTALLFFEHAKATSAPDDEADLRRAFDELDASAPLVYPLDELKLGVRNEGWEREGGLE